MPTYVVQLGGKRLKAEPAVLDLGDDDQARRFARACLIKAVGARTSNTGMHVDIGKLPDDGAPFLLGRWEWRPDIGYWWQQSAMASAIGKTEN